jgi:hypothetical protein
MKPQARLRPVKLEVPCTRRGRPSFKWVHGYQVVTPEGAELLPYMRMMEAIRFCAKQGWASKVVA